MAAMPNLRSQIVGPLDALGAAFAGKRGVHLQASDGRSITLTRADVLANFASQTGTRAARKLKTMQWVKDQIVAALGAEQIDPAGIAHDFDDATGEVTALEVAG